MNKIQLKLILFFLALQVLPVSPALAQDTNFVRAQYEAGVLAFKQQQYAQAIQHLKRPYAYIPN